MWKKLFSNREKRSEEDFRMIFSEFYKSISLISDLGQLKTNFSAHIREMYPADKVLVYHLDPDLNRFMVIGESKEDTQDYKSFMPDDKLVFWLGVNKKWLNINREPKVMEFLSNKEQRILKAMNARLIYPFVLMNQVKGFGVICKKEEFSVNEDQLRLLTLMFDQASFAFENAMLYHSQKEKTKKLYRADRLATLGELAAGAAHEIRNPLTSIRSTIQYLENRIPDEEDKDLASDLIGEVDRINEIIQGMLSFAKVDQLTMREIKLQQLIEDVIKLVKTTASKKNIELQFDYLSKDELIKADSGQIKQVVLNIMLNAIQSIDEGQGRVLIEVDSSEVELGKRNGKVYFIKISDNGKGISHDDLVKIFDPFYTTKQEGTGLGLSISYGIITKHGGDIEIESEIGEGTCVKIKLPALN